MTIERSNPLPVGRYWMDLIGTNAIERFVAYLKNADLGQGRIRVISSAHHEASGNEPEREWVLFDVLSAVMWDHAFYGSPTQAGPEVKSEADTVQRPDFEVTPLDVPISDLVKNPFEIAVGLAVGVGVALGLAYAVKSVVGRKRGQRS